MTSSAAEEKQNEPRGLLRITAPVEFGEILGELLARFALQYPEIHSQVNLTGRYVDLIQEGYDVAIRAGELADSSLVARRLKGASLGLFASASYLKENPKLVRPSDLVHHSCVYFRSANHRATWELIDSDGNVESVDIKGS